MKKLLFLIILSITFLLTNCNHVFAQESITLDRETAERALKAIELAPALQKENDELRKLVKEFEAQKTTPCSISLNNAERLIAAIPMGEPGDTKAMIKARKEQRKLVKYLIINSVKSQCGWQSSEPVWKTLLKLSPIAAAILLK